MSYLAQNKIAAAKSTAGLIGTLYTLPEHSIKPQPVVDKLTELLSDESPLIRFVAARVLSIVLLEAAPSQALDPVCHNRARQKSIRKIA